MSSFAKSGGASNKGGDDEGGHAEGPAAFFRKLRQNVTEAVVRPVPGIIKMTNASKAPSETAIGAPGPKELAHSQAQPPPLLQQTPSNGSLPSGNYTFSLDMLATASKPSATNSSAHHAAGNSTSTGNGNSASNTTGSGSSAATTAPSSYKISQFEAVLQADNVDLVALKKLSWNGVPAQFRSQTWQLMLGFLPTNKSRRSSALTRKREEYFDSVTLYFDVSEADRTTHEGELLRQIQVDLPRTCPDTPLFQQKPLQQAMERILYIWAIRHPASGYVQGMNDLLAPLLYICINPYTNDVLRCDVGALDSKVLLDIEADTYWCLTKLLDNIQDHYTFSQPGLQRMVLRLEDLVHRLDTELHDHFMEEGLQYMQFSFRWMNCILLRELPLKAILRLWDTYLAEEDGGFENFHVYVCVVFLKVFKERLMDMQFQDIMMFLQEIPTTGWDEEDIEPILSQAYILSTLFENSPSHLS